MGAFYVSCEVRDVRSRAKPVVARNLLVDTGSEFSWLPSLQLRASGVRVEKKDVPFVMANGQQVTRSTGYAILRVGDFETVDEVVFAQAGDLSLLGARALGGFGAAGPHVAAPGRG